MAAEVGRYTLATEARLDGAGLHSGTRVTIKLVPSDSGIRFYCPDQMVEARAKNVTDTSRCTRLGPVSTVEHIMAALACHGVTDLDIVLDAEELPALDGASGDYAAAISESGIEECGLMEVSLFERVFFVEEEIRIAIAKGEGHWRFDFLTGERWPQSLSFESVLNAKAFDNEIAGARTFAFEEEVPMLLSAGLAKGLDMETALILGEEGYKNEPKWPDEPARHKLLDLIGDLYLSGVPPTLINVVAVKSGHRTNIEAAKRLEAHASIVRS